MDIHQETPIFGDEKEKHSKIKSNRRNLYERNEQGEMDLVKKSSQSKLSKSQKPVQENIVELCCLLTRLACMT